MTIANAGVLLSMQGRQEAADEVLSYLLGRNPLGTCFVTGFGTVAPEAPHHRPSMAVGKAQPGMLVGGVNSALEDSAAKAYCKTEPAAKCYIDNAESYSTNEITIYWNSPLVYLLAVSEAAQNAAPEIPEEQTTTTTTEPQPQAGLRGDVNEDGAVDVEDVVLLARFLTEDGEAVVSGQGKLNADVNDNGAPDTDDCPQILKYIAKLIDKL